MGVDTGLRIRQRREYLGMKQAELARVAGVSASYLNLIEHGRRRIGGKLLLSIAGALETEPVSLTEGEDPVLLAELRAAARENGDTGALVPEDPEVLLQHSPDWAKLILAQQARISALQKMVTVLNNRARHDPKLAESLHEMLSTVTAIRSAASILAQPKDVSPEWQGRFSRNILEDSRRLAEASRGLASYLEIGTEDGSEAAKAPEDELAEFQKHRAHHVAELEAQTVSGDDSSNIVSAILTESNLSEHGKTLLESWLNSYAKDVSILSLSDLADALMQDGPDPFVIANRLGLAPDLVMRRMANLPADIAHSGGAIGLIICDASGALIYQKPLPELAFSNSHLSAGPPCPRLPLFKALIQPLSAIRTIASVPGVTGDLICDAIALPNSPSFLPGQVTQLRAHMLVRRAGPSLQEATNQHREPIGITCRICPRQNCDQRRVPSLLAEPQALENIK